MNVSALILQYLTSAGVAANNNAKASILGEMFRDPDCSTAAAEFVHYVLDPKFNFYQTAKKLPKPAIAPEMELCEYGMDGLMVLLDWLAIRKITGKVQEVVLADFLHCTTPDTRALFMMAINRQLPGNIGRTIVNKAYPGLVYKQPYGGVAPWDGEQVERRFNFADAVMLEKKEDGMTLLVDLETHEVRTRQGQDVTVQMQGAFDTVFDVYGPKDCVMHYEAKMLDEKGNLLLPRPKANGQFNKIFKGDKRIEPKRSVLVALDCIERDVFYGYKKGGLDAEQRYRKMFELVCAYWDVAWDHPEWLSMSCVELEWVYSLKEARGTVQEWIANGYEGGVLKDPKGMWSSTKMVNQMKIKNEFECTLMVIGYKAHKKHPHWVGSLRCVSDDNEIDTYVGSGLNEDPDSELCRTNGYDHFHGALVELKAEKISKNNALDLPRIIEIRHDKDRADNYKEVLAAYADSVSLLGY